MSHLYVLRTETQNVRRKRRLGNAGDAARHLEYLRVHILCDMFDDCFELDGLGQLAEVEKISVESEVVSLDIGAIPENRLRCRFLAVGLSDSTVRIFSLDPESCLQKLSTQV